MLPPHVIIIIISTESGIELPLKGNPRESDTQSGKVSTRYVHSEENSEGLGEKVKPIILRRLIPFLFSHHKAHQHQHQQQQWSRRAKVRRSRGHTVPEGQQPVMATRVYVPPPKGRAMTGRGAVTGADYKQIDNALMISQRKLFHFQFHLGPNLWFPIFRQFLFRVSVSLTHSLTSTGHQPAPLEIYVYLYIRLCVLGNALGRK